MMTVMRLRYDKSIRLCMGWGVLPPQSNSAQIPQIQNDSSVELWAEACLSTSVDQVL